MKSSDPANHQLHRMPVSTPSQKLPRLQGSTRQPKNSPSLADVDAHVPKNVGKARGVPRATKEVPNRTPHEARQRTSKEDVIVILHLQAEGAGTIGWAQVLKITVGPTFYGIWKNKTVEEYSAVPYLATLLNSMMWLLYGLPAVTPHNMLIITINVIGITIELHYIALFLAYSVGAARRRVLLILVAEVAFVCVVAALVLNLTHTHTHRSMVVGILGVFFETAMYAAPLSVMKMVIQTKSVEYMPLFLSLASLACGISWTAYALIKFDLYITIPNVLGVIFAVGQVILYAIYYKSTQQILKARKVKASRVPVMEVVVDGKNGSATASGAGNDN